MMTFVFGVSYLLLFCIGGTLSFIGIPYRMAAVSFFVLLILFYKRPPLNRVTFFFIVLAVEILISMYLNQLPLNNAITFYRFIVTPFAMWFLTELYLNEKTIYKVLRFSIFLSMIQLPIVLFQKLFYPEIIKFAALEIDEIDIGFGSFYTKDDPALVIFIIGIILYLLYQNDEKIVKRNYRSFVLFWLTTTVFVTNSRLSQISLALIWVHYLFRQISFKRILAFGFSIALVLSIIIFLGFGQQIEQNFYDVSDQILLEGGDTDEGLQYFLEGGYSRQAAVIYYLSQPLSYFGDGPTRYYNPATEEFTLGNRGQIFTFYSEIGIIGVILSVLVLASLALQCNYTKPKIRFWYFFAISALMITTSVMSDASIMLAYNIFLRVGYSEHQNSTELLKG